MTVEEKRQPQPEEELQHQAGDGPPHGVDQRLAEHRIAEHRLILTEPHKFRLEGGKLAEGIAYADDQRHQKYSDQKHQSRADIKPGLNRGRGKTLAARLSRSSDF